MVEKVGQRLSGGEKSRVDASRIVEILGHFWEEEERSVREMIRKSHGPKALHEVRRSFRRRIRIGIFIGFAGCLSRSSRKDLAVLGKAYAVLGPWRERDVREKAWRQLCRRIPDIRKCAPLSRMGEEGKDHRRRRRLLERVLRKAERCAFPGCPSRLKSFRKEPVGDSSVFFFRLRTFLADRDAVLERFAARWDVLGAEGRHRLRKVVRVLHESWSLARKLVPDLPDGESDQILAKLDRSLGRLHDLDMSFKRLCRVLESSGRKGRRQALLVGWYAGVSGHLYLQVGQLLERYRKAPRPWAPVENRPFSSSDGFSPTG